MSQSTIRLVSAGNERTYVSGLRVAVYQRNGDETSGELLGAGRTNEKGELPFRLKAKNASPGSTREHVDLHVAVYDRDNRVVHVAKATRSQRDDLFIVPLEDDLLRRREIRMPKPPRPERTKRARFADYVAKHSDKSSPAPPDLCATRVVLETMASLANPKTDFQRQMARELTSKRNGFTSDDLKTVSQAAASGLQAALDLDGFRKTARCSGLGPKELVDVLITQPGPIHNIANALYARIPSPSEQLGDAEGRAGVPFAEPFEWSKNCAADYATEHHGQAPPLSQVLVGPRVNFIRVFDTLRANYVRDGSPSMKRTLVRELDAREESGWGEHMMNFDVPVNSADCLIKKAEPESGNQIYAIDVGVGQEIWIQGSGFVSEKAKIRVRRYDWAILPDDGRLVPQNASPVLGWDDSEASMVRVYGASSHDGETDPDAFTGDSLVFPWPGRLAEPGLYEMRFEFENHTNDPRLPSAMAQDGHTCELRRSFDNVLTTPIYFAVLRPALPRMVRPAVTQVVCEDETNPENFGPINFADDILLDAAIDLKEFTFSTDPDPTTDPMRIDPVLHRDIDPREQAFWNDGDEWNLDATLFSEGARRVDFTQFFSPTFHVAEIFGETDKAAWRLVIRASIVIVAAIVTALILALAVAAIVALIVAMIALDFETAGMATVLAAAIPAVCALAAALIAIVWGNALTWIMDSLIAIVDHMPASPDIIMSVMPLFHGYELSALLSPVRFHRALWTQPRPTRIEGAIPTDVSTEVFDQTVRETYTSSAFGGRYRLRLDLTTTVA